MMSGEYLLYVLQKQMWHANERTAAYTCRDLHKEKITDDITTQSPFVYKCFYTKCTANNNVNILWSGIWKPIKWIHCM